MCGGIFQLQQRSVLRPLLAISVDCFKTDAFAPAKKRKGRRCDFTIKRNIVATVNVIKVWEVMRWRWDKAGCFTTGIAFLKGSLKGEHTQMFLDKTRVWRLSHLLTIPNATDFTFSETKEEREPFCPPSRAVRGITKLILSIKKILPCKCN